MHYKEANDKLQPYSGKGISSERPVHSWKDYDLFK